MTTADEQSLRQSAERHGQAHLFHYWDALDSAQRSQLLGDVARIDFDLLDRLRRDEGVDVGADVPAESISAPPMYPPEPTGELADFYHRAHRLGQEQIAAGKVAAMVVAGGQGTRLGFDKPKGMFPISPIKNKTLFQLFAESLLASTRRYGAPIPWFVMTSEATDADTRQFFEDNRFFGLDPRHVHFFQQGVMPAIDEIGQVLLAARHRVALSPNGHGGSLTALRDSGALTRMREAGIETISYFQVDNPLVTPVDPLFVGMHAHTGSDMSSIAVPKVDDFEKVGHFVSVDGSLRIIEYSDLPEQLATARNADGTRLLDAGNVAIHAISRDFVERVTAPGSDVRLPWHRAHKKVAHIDLPTDQPVDPSTPNAFKFEMFIFDAIPLARQAIIWQRHRKECFSPVKNAQGTDSPATARRDMIARAATWLQRCGVAVPRSSDGEPQATLEISPIRALDADQLQASLTQKPTIETGHSLYLD